MLLSLFSVSLLPRRLRQLDLEVLKRLHRKVNVVPVIAKADTLTTYEVKKLKERILADIEEHEIQVASDNHSLSIVTPSDDETPLERRNAKGHTMLSA